MNALPLSGAGMLRIAAPAMQGPQTADTGRVIAIVNQKGGCGKTTSATNLAGCLAADGARVLVVDLDPQAHATLALGVDPEQVDENLYEVLAEPGGSVGLADVCVKTRDDLYVAPSGIVLSALEQKLATEPVETRTVRLADALTSVRDAFDYVLIDCPPNVGVLTFNALRAASEVIVPLETSYFAIHGVQKLLETIALLTERIGHDLRVRILPTLYDGRTRYARKTLSEIREMFKDLCFDTVIRQNVKLREAASRGKPINFISRRANGALDYAALAVEVGDFNGWVPDKGVRSLIESEGETRVWTKILQLPPGRYMYRYVVDGEWCEDPANPEAVSSTVGGRNSVLVVR
jgi:chromosome partitioning protein